MKILINISNHPSSKWSPEQRAGWDKIVDIQFPNIDPEADMDEIEALSSKIFEEVRAIYENWLGYIYVYVAGEYTFSYSLFYKLKQFGANVVIPTTRRVVEERLKDDGSIEKVAIFKFIRWRYL